MRVKLTVLNIKRRALSLIPEDGIFISEGDTFVGYVDNAPYSYLNLRYTENEEHDPTNFTAFGKIIEIDDGFGNYLITTKFGKFLVQEVSNGRYETMGHCH